jgi:hypothetical protein
MRCGKTAQPAITPQKTILPERSTFFESGPPFFVQNKTARGAGAIPPLSLPPVCKIATVSGVDPFWKKLRISLKKRLHLIRFVLCMARALLRKAPM